jgi:tRNA nucleotidyltransferase/poly(A) polymerase
MLDPARQRAFALEIAQKLRAAGYEALWAGGCVRDVLLGLTPKDYDVATNATPDQIRDLFGRRRKLPICASFGVNTVRGPREAGQIEVATFRTDAAYSDGRHPDSVTFTDAEHDAQRRDFTINGLFFDPVAEQVVDYVGGQQDLNAHILRAIGNPRLRLSEDRLRMLRAVRFAATFNFEIDADTLAAIQEMAPQINSVSAERIGAEIRRMLIDPNRARALSLLLETKLLTQVLPEVADLTAVALDETSHILASLKDPSISLALAAALSFVVATADSPIPAAIGRRLRYANKEIERTAWLLAKVPLIARAPRLDWPKLQRILTHDGIAELLALQEAIAGTSDPVLAFCRERLAWPVEQLNPRPLLDGSTLIHHGLTPGPHFSDLLERVRDAQLNGEISSQEEALALVDRLRASDKTLP